MIYLDYNATTPVWPEVLEVFNFYASEEFGNPSSAHPLGRRAREGLERAREQLASLLEARPEESVFVSGGTEANHLALLGVFKRYPQGHLLVSQIEHPSVLNPALEIFQQGWEVDFVPVDGKGYVDPEEVRKRLKPHTRLVSVMLANNETGAVQPVAEIGALCREAEVLFHTDAAQAVGKIPVSVKEIGCDLLTVAGHKMYAPKGIGALYIRKGLTLEPLFYGGGQERGLRPGTEPVALAAALGRAAEMAQEDLPEEAERERSLRERLWAGLQAIYPEAIRHGDPKQSLPNTLYVSFPGKSGAEILARVPEICASTGAACHSSGKISHVLSAMGVPQEVARGAIRFSLGRGTTLEEIETAVELLAQALKSP